MATARNATKKVAPFVYEVSDELEKLMKNEGWKPSRQERKELVELTNKYILAFSKAVKETSGDYFVVISQPSLKRTFEGEKVDGKISKKLFSIKRSFLGGMSSINALDYLFSAPVFSIILTSNSSSKIIDEVLRGTRWCYLREDQRVETLRMSVGIGSMPIVLYSRAVKT